MNYYNEFDPKSAAWLRELRASNQAHQANTSFYQSMRDTLGTIPKPFQAICSSLRFSIDHCARILACWLRPKPEFLHNFRKLLEHSDCFFGISTDLILEVVSPLSFGDRRIAFLDSSCAIPARFLQLSPFGIHRNMSTFGFDLDGLETSYHKIGKHVRLLDSVCSPISISRRIFENRTLHQHGGTHVVFRTLCTFLKLPCADYGAIPQIFK